MPSSGHRSPDRCPVPSCGISFHELTPHMRDELVHGHNIQCHWLVYCHPCRRLFDSPADVTSHKDRRHPVCHLCRQRFRSAEEKEDHFRKIHPVVYCSKCNYRPADGVNCVCSVAEGINDILRESGKTQSCFQYCKEAGYFEADRDEKPSGYKYRDEGNYFRTGDDHSSSSNKGSSTRNSNWEYRDSSSKSKTKDGRSHHGNSHSSKYTHSGRGGNDSDDSSSDDDRHHRSSSSRSKPKADGRDRHHSSSKSHSKSEERRPPPAAEPPAPDYYTLIGIASTTSEADLLKAVKKARIANHPDRFMNKNLSPKELEKVVERAKCIGQACDVLEDPKARRVYDAKLQSDKLNSRKSRYATPPPPSDFPLKKKYQESPLRNEYKPSNSSSGSPRKDKPRSSSSGSPRKDESSKPRSSGSSRKDESPKSHSSSSSKNHSSSSSKTHSSSSSSSSKKSDSSKTRPSDRHGKSRRLSDVDEEMTDV